MARIVLRFDPFFRLTLIFEEKNERPVGKKLSGNILTMGNHMICRGKT